MKYTSAVAAATLLGSASAGVHKMKLKKVPLSEQLVRNGSIDKLSTCEG
jgi:saccharopepsin